EQMGKDLPPNGDLKTPQVGEIGFAQLPWPVLLRKIDFLCRSSRRPPVLDLALQRPQLPLREPLRILPLQLRKNRLGFQPRVPAQLLFNFPPHVLELILVRSPVTLRLYLARQPSRAQVLSPRLHVHPRLGRRDLLRPLRVRHFEQPPDLLVCDHPENALLPAPPDRLSSLQVGKNNCRQPGILIVAHQKDGAYVSNGAAAWVKVKNRNYSQERGRREMFESFRSYDAHQDA